MTQEIMTQQQVALMDAQNGMNVGSVAIESQRAIAEAQGQLTLAKKFPRNLQAAFAELMEACASPALAGVAFYTLPRGKNSVTGPSIRLAEEIARVYGNFQYGHRELSRDAKKSEVEVYAWDMEKNNYSKRQLTVMHVLDTKEGPRPLRDQKDIDDKIANVASKQVRGRILALVPKWLSEAAIQKCRDTLAGNSDVPVADRVRKMLVVFAKFGVTVKHLEANLGHSLEEVTTDEIADLTGIFNALKDGAKVSEYFGDTDVQEANDSKVQLLTTAAAAGNQTREEAKPAAKKADAKPPKNTKPAEPKPEPKPAPTPEPEPTPDLDAENGTGSNIPETNSNTVEDHSPQNPENAPIDAADAQNDAPAADVDPAAQADDVF